MKRPAFQFYPGDWMRDAALRSCSLVARGLWMELLCLMHDGQPYGFLRVGSKVLDDVAMARMVGESVDIVRAAVAELEAAAVFSRAADGAIFSRRMVRDEDIRSRRAAGGHLSEGHPRVAPRKDGRKDTHRPILARPVKDGEGAPIDPSPASPTASASSKNDLAGREPVTVISDRFDAFWKRYPRQDGREPAWKVYLDIYPNEAHAAEILAGVERFRKTAAIERALATNELSFVPLAKNWLRDLRWQDTGQASTTAAPLRVCQHRHTPPCIDAAACSSRYLRELHQTSPATAEARA